MARSGANQKKTENNAKTFERGLKCLYDIGLEIDSEGSVADILRNCSRHLLGALQFPHVAHASIRIDDNGYGLKPVTDEMKGPLLSAEIVSQGKKRGIIDVCYDDNLEFLKEEKDLIGHVARMLSRVVERQDVRTELERYAIGLQKSKKLFDYAPVPLLISRISADVVKANRAFCQLLGYPEDGSARLDLITNRVYADPEVKSLIFRKLTEEGRLEGFELTLLDREGNPIPVSGSYTLMELDGERFFQAAYKDLRVRKDLERRLLEQNENLERNVRGRTLDLENQKDLLVKQNQELVTLTEKLRQSKTRLQALFKAITDTVTVIDPDLNILMSNQKAIGSRGKCYKKVFGRDEQCNDCLMKRLMEERTAVTQERVVNDEYYVLQAYPIFDSNCQVTGVLEINRVVTKEKNMERQLLQADKLASLGQLVSGIGHEINNPNTFIRGNLHIVQEAMNDIFPLLDTYYRSHQDLKIARLNYDIFRKSIPTLIEDMVQGANRIKGIVEGLSKFAKRDEGFLNETVNLNVITESCLRLVDNQVRRTADVKVDFHPELPAITGNSQKLQQVIVNILINASQAIDKSRGTIKVSTRFSEKEVTLRIKDNGKGMDEKTIGQIFDPFFTTKRNKGGTGLGLSIAYGIIKEHKGRIEVVSEVGVGTTFCVYVPRERKGYA